MIDAINSVWPWVGPPLLTFTWTLVAYLTFKLLTDKDTHGND